MSRVNPNIPDRESRLPLHAAVFKGRTDVVEALLDYRADPNLEEVARANGSGKAASGDKPLSLAAYQGHISVAQLLIKHGAKVNSAGKRSPTPLCTAARRGNTKLVRLLLASGADPHLRSPASNANGN